MRFDTGGAAVSATGIELGPLELGPLEQAASAKNAANSAKRLTVQTSEQRQEGPQGNFTAFRASSAKIGAARRQSQRESSHCSSAEQKECRRFRISTSRFRTVENEMRSA
jgi:hypothetical protein